MRSGFILAASTLVGLSCMVVACGEAAEDQSTATTSQKVINGTEVVPNSVPYMAFLSGLSQSPGGHRCGASLIDERHVLTAAHCVIERSYVLNGSMFDIVLGAHDISNVDNEPNVQKIEGEFIAVHPGFANAPSHDIAVIRLAEPAVLNSAVQTIALARSGGDEVGNNVFLTGWGKYTSTSSKSMELLGATFPIQTNQTCTDQLGTALDDSMLCAGSIPDQETRLTSCHGDSGGPLVNYDHAGNPFQVGVVSWGDPDVCRYEGVFSRVTSQIDWIDWVLASQYRYLRCGNTGWDLSDDTRMTLQSNNTYTIEYDVTNINDSCVITHTNELNGWGTKSGDYKMVFDGSTFEPGEEATLTWEGDYPTHFQINYPTAGRYRLRFQPTLSVGMQNKIGIYRVD